MSKTVTVELTAEQGNWLLQRLAGFELPEKLGEVKYDSQARSNVKDDCRLAMRALRAISHYAKLVGDDNRLVFGSEDNWVKDVTADGKIRLVDAGRLYKIEFNEDAVTGIMWMFYALLLPSERKDDGTVIHASVAPITAELFIWPVVEQMNKAKALRSTLGLDNATKKTRWDDDPKPQS